MKTKWETVYTGTSIENYIACASIDGRGRMIFDKRKQKESSWGELYVTILFDTAAQYAYNLCLNLKIDGRVHNPLVVEGCLPAGDYLNVPMKRNLPVRAIWTPNEGVDLGDWMTHFPEYFRRLNHTKFLKA